MQSLTLPTPIIVSKRIGRATKTHFRMFESMGELGDFCAARQAYEYCSNFWSGGLTGDQAARTCHTGDLSRVARSDALLARMEQFELLTARARWTDDVAGPAPNVPAYLAGHPLAMRRRYRNNEASAPLAIIADLTCSAQIDAEDIEKRGAAILALVRVMSARRPIELWVCSSQDADQGGNAGIIAARIETAPLDLATATYALTHAAVPRRLMYGVGRKETAFAGGWPFNRGALSRAEMEAMLAPVMSHVTQTLCLPAIHAKDPALKDPAAWIAREIAQHDPIALAEAEEA